MRIGKYGIGIEVDSQDMHMAVKDRPAPGLDLARHHLLLICYLGIERVPEDLDIEETSCEDRQ